jgi:hypothetical protein
MSVWITDRLPISAWGAVQFRVMLVQQEMRMPLHLAMLVRSGALGEPDDVFVLLPDASLAARFPGFVEIGEAAIPSSLRMLVGPASGFEKRFPEIAAKIMMAA